MNSHVSLPLLSRSMLACLGCLCAEPSTRLTVSQSLWLTHRASFFSPLHCLSLGPQPAAITDTSLLSFYRSTSLSFGRLLQRRYTREPWSDFDHCSRRVPALQPPRPCWTAPAPYPCPSAALDHSASGLPSPLNRSVLSSACA